MGDIVQFGFGLRLASDIPVPGAIGGNGPEMRPAIAIELIERCEPAQEPGFTLEGGAIIYSHPCGRFRCEAERISIAPGERVSTQDLGELLVANALPAVLWQRGALMLHAACVKLPNGPSVAIAGHSGSGKSRLAAALVAGGAELIGDDSLALYSADQGILAQGLPGGWFARSADGTAREFVPAASGQFRGECFLDLLVVLDSDVPKAARLAPLAAMEQLLRNRHRPQVPLLLGQQARVLAQAAAIARQLPVATIAAEALVTRDPSEIAAVLTSLA